MMQWIDDKDSPYGRRLVCAGAEIDLLMEDRYIKFLNRSCDWEHPALDIERFIDETLVQEEINFDPEADLSRFVLGSTLFQDDGSKFIKINAMLYRQRNTPSFKGRYRFTCAHEVFHALYHGSLFQDSKGEREIRCFENHFSENVAEPSKSSRDFIEWQANRGAAALLMPATIFEQRVKIFRAKSKSFPALVQDLMMRFDVSKQSVEIRLKSLGFLAALAEDDFILENDGIDSYQDPRQRKWY